MTSSGTASENQVILPLIPSRFYRKSCVGSCARVQVELCREEASLRAIKRDWCLSGELDLHDPLLYLPLFALISLSLAQTHTHTYTHTLVFMVYGDFP